MMCFSDSREYVREIGLLKIIGASGISIVLLLCPCYEFLGDFLIIALECKVAFAHRPVNSCPPFGMACISDDAGFARLYLVLYELL